MKKTPVVTLDRDWLTKQQTADYLQITARTVMSYVEAGKLVAVRPGGKDVRISAASIRRLMNSTSTHARVPNGKRSTSRGN